MAKKEDLFEIIKKDVNDGKIAQIYLLQGEEEYYIDALTDLITAKALKDDERDFNQTIFYGADSEPADVINACKRFPLMADRQLVVLKEAQNMKDKKLEELIYYVQKPLASTVLVICHKQGKLDGRKNLSKEISKKGVVFESTKLYENQIPAFIINYLKKKHIAIDDKAAQLLADYLGTNISKITNELEKLIISLPPDNKTITSTLIEQNIGISKDFNNFELQSAIARKNILKANRIAHYFEQNPKSNPLVLTLTVLFNFFSLLLICHYFQAENRRQPTQSDYMQIFGIRNPYDKRLDEYYTALRNYGAKKCMNIITLIRECDARSKGVGNLSLTDGMLLKELIYKILH